MAPETAGSLFDPEGFGAGGFLDDVDCTIIEARVVNGADTPMTEAGDRTFLKVTYDPDAEDAESRDEYYGLGPIEKFTPSKDGKRVVYEAGTKINKNSKSALFFAGLINAGFPKSSLPADGNVTFLEGLHVHVNNVPMPEMRGKQADKFKKKDGAPPTVVLVTKILETAARTGGVKKAAVKPNGSAGAPTPAANTAAPAAPAGSGEAEGVTVAAILEIIAEKGMATKRLLPTEIMARIADAKTRTAAFKLIGDNNWLGGADRPWAFDQGSGELRLG